MTVTQTVAADIVAPLSVYSADREISGEASPIYTEGMELHLRSLPVCSGAALLLFSVPAPCAPVETPAAGSPAFCLFEVPASGERRQWVNLAHILYIEQRNEEIRAYFGGGNLGSGHEARIPAKTPEEAAAVLQKMRNEAARCAGK